MAEMAKTELWRRKRILITGASSGIGASLAKIAASQGAHLSLLARRADRLLEVQKVAAKAGGKIVTFRGDVKNSLEVEAAVENAVRELGGLDVVIANAGFGVTGPFSSLSNDDYRRQFDVNIFGVLRTVRAALPELKKSRGTIAILASISSYVSTGGDSAYAMSKAAIRAFADSLYLELKSEGVHVALICPGFVESEIRAVDNRGVHHTGTNDPVPRWLVMDADSAARVILSGILARQREVIVTRHGKLLLWIRRFFPGLMFYLLAKFPIQRRPKNLSR